LPAGLRRGEGGGNCHAGMNEEGKGTEGCVSMTAINGLIMYLAVLAVVKRVKRSRG